MSVHRDNTTPISNDGIVRLGPMVRSQIRVPGGGADLRRTDHHSLFYNGLTSVNFLLN